MNKRIIYKTENNELAIVCPAIDCGLTIEEIAAKDVPNGVEFKIVDIADALPDGSFVDPWKI